MVVCGFNDPFNEHTNGALREVLSSVGLNPDLEVIIAKPKQAKISICKTKSNFPECNVAICRWKANVESSPGNSVQHPSLYKICYFLLCSNSTCKDSICITVSPDSCM